MPNAEKKKKKNLSKIFFPLQCNNNCNTDPNSIYSYYTSSEGMQLLTRFRLSLSHLR